MKLTHETIGDLQGGAIGVTLDQAISEAMRDVHNRPMLKTGRKVVLTITLNPLVGGGLQDNNASALSGVGVVAEVKTSFPSRKGDVDVMSVEQVADSNGEPVVTANFMQVPLMRSQEN